MTAFRGAVISCQKAPSAKRCIKTRLNERLIHRESLLSESTERQKVH